MDVWFMDRAEVSYLDDLLLEPVPRPPHPHRLPRPVPVASLAGIPLPHLQQWCGQRGVYQIVTDELLNWLAGRIKGKRAVEICAGHGTLGRSLGIPVTDSYMQVRPEIRLYYQKLRQATIHPPPDVLKLDAHAAVVTFAPEVVIGAWVTQKWIPGEKNGSIEGVDEMTILAAGADYIHIGNDRTHDWKQLMKQPHDHYYFPWLVSRAQDQSLNHLCVWRGRA